MDAGIFVLRDLPPGPLEVAAESASGVRQSQTVNDGTAEITLRLGTGATLQGTLRAENGELERASVTLSGLETGFFVTGTIVTEPGEFEMKLIPEGEYVLRTAFRIEGQPERELVPRRIRFHEGETLTLHLVLRTEPGEVVVTEIPTGGSVHLVPMALLARGRSSFRRIEGMSLEPRETAGRKARMFTNVAAGDYAAVFWTTDQNAQPSVLKVSVASGRIELPFP